MKPRSLRDTYRRRRRNHWTHIIEQRGYRFLLAFYGANIRLGVAGEWRKYATAEAWTFAVLERHMSATRDSRRAIARAVWAIRAKSRGKSPSCIEKVVVV